MKIKSCILAVFVIKIVISDAFNYPRLKAKPTIAMSNAQLLRLITDLARNFDDTLCVKSEKCANEWVKRVDYIAGKVATKTTLLYYNLHINITSIENQLEMQQFSSIADLFRKITKLKSTQFLKNSNSWKDSRLKRLLFLISQNGYFDNQDASGKFAELGALLQAFYSQITACPNANECLLEQDIVELFGKTRDYDKLKWAWKVSRQSFGNQMTEIYAEMVNLANEAARKNGYNDLSEIWISEYEDANFERDYDDLYAKIRPLYEQLHAYVRRKLRQVYGHKYPRYHNPKLIPAHILGSYIGAPWINVLDMLMPYKHIPQKNLTQVLIEKKYTPTKMFRLAEDFFKSLGMFKMTPNFWKYSMFEKPANRQVLCDPAAYDFYNGYDYRIRICSRVDENYLTMIHHEMGHVEYYMAYRNQPNLFKQGANSAFHEAIGDTISLSVLSPDHFKRIGLLPHEPMNSQQEINDLFKLALRFVSSLPLSYMIDKWRWNVFRGNIKKNDYDKVWWQMREKYTGLEAPDNDLSNDFDPGVIFHVISFVPFSRYFIGNILQFQFYKALCTYAGHRGPLYKCDFYKSKNAGYHLKKMLELGASKHWSYALNVLTNQTKVSADALLEYFSPLEKWLRKENAKYVLKPGF